MMLIRLNFVISTSSRFVDQKQFLPGWFADAMPSTETALRYFILPRAEEQVARIFVWFALPREMGSRAAASMLSALNYLRVCGLAGFNRILLSLTLVSSGGCQVRRKKSASAGQSRIFSPLMVGLRGRLSVR
jgi:hypothetical protein